MAQRNGSLETKEKCSKIKKLAHDLLPEIACDRNEISEKIVQNFCFFTPPKPPCKPGEFTINWKNLFSSIPHRSTGSGIDKSWCWSFAGLIICKEIFLASEITVDVKHAIAMLIMWDMKNSKGILQKEKVFDSMNKYLRQNNENEINYGEFWSILETLRILKCIDLDEDGDIDEGMIWVREWVTRPYFN